MHPHLFLIITFILILILIHTPTSLCSDEQEYLNCSKPFTCANISNIGYPFWNAQNRSESCGYPGFELDCTGDAPLLTLANMPYRILSIDNSTYTLNIVRDDYWTDNCPEYLLNTTLDFSLVSYDKTTQNLTLYYGCAVPGLTGQFMCTINDTTSVGYFVTESLASLTASFGTCSEHVLVPVTYSAVQTIESNFASSNLTAAIHGGFDVQWAANNTLCLKCAVSGGQCGYNTTTGGFACYCPDGSTNCGVGSSSKSSNISLPIGIAIGGAGIVGILVGFLVFYYRQRRKKIADLSKRTDLPPTPSSKSLIPTPTTNFSQSNPSYASSRSTDLEKGSTYFGVQVFSYTELEQATENFDPSKELGEGGFGTVYYGKLHDGRVVAVKRLYENNFKRVEQFMNEVEILTRLRHKNLVVLYGCTSRRSRELLLVYEYIPNGTVADHLHGKKANSGLLTWPVRLSIAIETADALAYLHASDIIHRDVKTNNILLDNDFRVKVADFGLSRLFPNDVTHVSTAPQGTPGYVDPEYYQCYQLTDKSDVYSFGVVLIELISSKEAVDTNRHRHDINLANMAVNKIQNHTLHELVDPCLGFETDLAVMRMTTAVAELAFRCLQQEKDMRPTMEEVLRILRGIENEEFNVEKPEVVDIRADDIGLLKSLPPPSYSPDSIATDKWVPNSF